MYGQAGQIYRVIIALAAYRRLAEFSNPCSGRLMRPRKLREHEYSTNHYNINPQAMGNGYLKGADGSNSFRLVPVYHTC